MNSSKQKNVLLCKETNLLTLDKSKACFIAQGSFVQINGSILSSGIGSGKTVEVTALITIGSQLKRMPKSTDFFTDKVQDLHDLGPRKEA